jgi:hypothetical protein
VLEKGRRLACNLGSLLPMLLLLHWQRGRRRDGESRRRRRGAEAEEGEEQE